MRYAIAACLSLHCLVAPPALADGRTLHVTRWEDVSFETLPGYIGVRTAATASETTVRYLPLDAISGIEVRDGEFLSGGVVIRWPDAQVEIDKRVHAPAKVLDAVREALRER